jgi:hypothetical protein
LELSDTNHNRKVHKGFRFAWIQEFKWCHKRFLDNVFITKKTTISLSAKFSPKGDKITTNTSKCMSYLVSHPRGNNQKSNEYWADKVNSEPVQGGLEP